MQSKDTFEPQCAGPNVDAQECPVHRKDTLKPTEATFDALKWLRFMSQYEEDNEFGATFREAADALEALQRENDALKASHAIMFEASGKKDAEIEQLKKLLRGEREYQVKKHNEMLKVKYAFDEALR